MSVTVKGDKKTLHIEVTLDSGVRSASGKTILLGSTHGLMPTGIMYKGREIILILNTFIFPKKKKQKYSPLTIRKIRSKSKVDSKG